MKDYEKQIEEAAIESSNGSWNESDWTSGFIYGAKSPEAKEYWQQGMYSEEEVKRLCSKAWLIKGDINDLIYQFDNWFEQNKKK